MRTFTVSIQRFVDASNINIIDSSNIWLSALSLYRSDAATKSIGTCDHRFSL